MADLIYVYPRRMDKNYTIQYVYYYIALHIFSDCIVFFSKANVSLISQVKI